jgi:hypothetical protein
MCWKCSNKIIEPDITGFSYKLVGCAECNKITDYPTAQMYCPLMKEENRRKPLPGKDL